MGKNTIAEVHVHVEGRSGEICNLYENLFLLILSTGKR